MAMIQVPKPDTKSAMNPDRPVSALLKAQIEHLAKAERILPLKYRVDIYANAIRTEGEAAEYIRHVTEAIHEAHGDAARRRERPVVKRARGIAIAAAAQEPALRQQKKSSLGKKKGKVKRVRKA